MPTSRAARPSGGSSSSPDLSNSDKGGRPLTRLGEPLDGGPGAGDHPRMRLLERDAVLAALTEYAADARGGDGRLVLVAEPRFLGMLRGELDHVTGSMVSGTLSKDLAHVSIAELPGHLKSVVLI